jgi:hypothetical protein
MPKCLRITYIEASDTYQAEHALALAPPASYSTGNSDLLKGDSNVDGDAQSSFLEANGRWSLPLVSKDPLKRDLDTPDTKRTKESLRKRHKMLAVCSYECFPVPFALACNSQGTQEDSSAVAFMIHLHIRPHVA